MGRGTGLARILISGIALLATPSAAQKIEVPGFVFAQLTDNGQNDWLPRVSGTGIVAPGRPLVTWTGAYQLPQAASRSSTDLEVFLWDGHTLEQVTDDDVASTRPAVNNLREIAFQTGGTDLGSDLAVRTAAGCWKVTNDPNRDRYPDLHDNGIVVWGHEVDDGQFFVLGSYDLRRRAPFRLSSFQAYRPHINAANQVESAATWLRFPDGTLLAPGPRPADYGYSIFWRAELNDFGWMLIEAAPNPPSQETHDTGPRDLLFWDGSAMRLVYHSPDTWAGRGDLNRRGLLVWEGRGGLPGATSDPGDTEIFVFDPEIGTVEQITDDDLPDDWPTVLEDDTIVWVGQGGFAGARSPGWDFEIFLACPDRDADGTADLTSLCSTPEGSRQIAIETSFVGPSARDCNRLAPLPEPGAGAGLAATLLATVWVRRRRPRPIAASRR